MHTETKLKENKRKKKHLYMHDKALIISIYCKAKNRGRLNLIRDKISSFQKLNKIIEFKIHKRALNKN